MNIGQLYLRGHDRPAPSQQVATKADVLLQALHELSALGSPDRIADFLVERTVRGIPNLGFHCALANYLRELTGFRVVGVGVTETVYPGGKIQNSVEIRAFLWRFDAGEYLGLLDPVTRPDFCLA